jgi:concanavalin A-like lectin/glucanase superfamily protein
MRSVLIVGTPVVGSGPPHLLNNLISYWKLDEAGTPTSLADSKGTNTLTGANLSASAFIINNGQYVNNSGFMTVADNVSLHFTSDFTWSLWVRVDIPSNDRHLLSKWDGSTSSYGFLHSATSGLGFYAGSGSTASVGAPSGAYSVHHIVGWWDSVDQKSRIRVDDAATYVAATSGALTPNAGPLDIGGLVTSPQGYNWSGLIDEVGVWKRKLTASEITALYNGGAGLPFSSFTT